jgi:hypothetical protein
MDGRSMLFGFIIGNIMAGIIWTIVTFALQNGCT